MSIDKIKQRIIENSIKDSGWLEKATWREENEDWLDISFSIAVRIASTLSANKKANTFPKTQAQLAEAMGCSAQYVNKVLKGQENLQIETIAKIGRILGISLIEVPKIEVKQTVNYQDSTVLVEKSNVKSTPTKTTVAYQTEIAKVAVNTNIAGENNYALAA
ncbi:helix-turn-helix domain-containing protein [Flavobacterium sp.]|uniref:helix-turn-helix domain-containing protein n=3 Tax=Flavobacterium sp. TaxID=239 RepID=UPI004048DC9C